MMLLLIPSSSPDVNAYEATWESLDSRPIPEWYPKAKIGIFLHWGVFSVPAFKNEWFWNRWQLDSKGGDYKTFVDDTEATRRFGYPDYASRFDATL